MRLAPAALWRALAAFLFGAAGCSSYVGAARDFSPSALDREPGWIAVRSVPYLEQEKEADCGAAALAMVVSYWTGDPPGAIAARLRPVPPKGLEAGRLREVAREFGLAAFLVKGEVADLERELRSGRPVLVGLIKPQRSSAFSHYELVVALHPRRRIVVTLDPAEGWRRYDLDGFLVEWQPAEHLALVVSATKS